MRTVCPNCHHQELLGALFCSECGTKLVEQSGLSTEMIGGTDSKLVNKKTAPPTPTAPLPAIDAIASLHILLTGQILPLVGRDEYTIGRISEGQSILPDVDLTHYEAYAKGVSRLHATIKINSGRMTVTDLGSSNGTRVNSNKITPHKEHEVEHGDLITLGKFKLQALYRQDE
ncbi:MAG: FHA domain-containing protein [Chloroflexota bacterium]